MTALTSPKPLHLWLLIFVLILIGINLRPALAAIGPLLPQIQATIPASFSLISLLTMLPVLVIGLGMFWGVRIATKLGEHNAIALGLVVIGVASLARFYATSIMYLILTAILAGTGIALIQAVMPVIIKSRFARSVPLLMGVYVTAIMGGAALAAASSPYIVLYTGSWQLTLALWSGLAVVALIVWFAIRNKLNQDTNHQSPNIRYESFIKNRRAWLLGIFFGFGTAAYTCILAWLSPYYIELGWQDTHAGLLLAYLTSVEVIAGLAMPALASRFNDRRAILIGLLLLMIIGFAGLLFVPTAYPILWTGLLGFGIGGIFPLSLIVTMDHIEMPHRAGQLTAFVQGVGYLIAAFSPLIAGYIRDTFASFDYAWLLLSLMTISMIGIAWCFNPKYYASYFVASK